MMERRVPQRGYSASLGEEDPRGTGWETTGITIISDSEQALAAIIAQALLEEGEEDGENNQTGS